MPPCYVCNVNTLYAHNNSSVKLFGKMSLYMDISGKSEILWQKNVML